MRTLSLAWIVAAFSLVGCSGQSADTDADEQSEEPIDEASQALVPGNWVASYGYPAAGAFTTGQPSFYLPVCRANYDGGKHPGKFWQGECWFEWGNAAHHTPSFETLVNTGTYDWYPMWYWGCDQYGLCGNIARPVPQNAIDGGPAGWQAGQVPLPVCMAYKGGEWHPGKFYKGMCNIEWGGQGLALPIKNELGATPYYIHVAVKK